MLFDSTIETTDMQHDYALGLAYLTMYPNSDAVNEHHFLLDYVRELVRRNAVIPRDCKLVYSPYAALRKKLVYVV